MVNRRKFLGTTALAALGTPLLAGQTKQSAGRSPNDKIQIALIGCGGMGQTDANSSVATGLTKLVAACDCYDGRLERMKEEHGKDIFTTRDYHQILDRKDIDAVIVGTPITGTAASPSMPLRQAKTFTAKSRWCSTLTMACPSSKLTSNPAASCRSAASE